MHSGITFMKRFLLLGLALSLMFTAHTVLAADSQKKGPEKIKAAFVYAYNIGDYGWIYSHDQARKKVDEKLDFVETTGIENVPKDSNAERVLTDLVKEGYNVIVCTSFDYQKTTLKVAKQFPNVYFLNSTGSAVADNVGAYFGKTFQGNYVAGVLAGLMTKTNKLGYVGGNPINVGLLDVNAYILGARQVNKDATLKIIWINTWFNPAKEREAAMSLVDVGADVLGHDTNTPAVHQAAQAKGVYSIGRNSDMSRFAPDAVLTGISWTWDGYYEPVFRAIHEGAFKPGAYWGGLKDGVVSLEPFAGFIPADKLKIVEEYKAKVKAGEPIFKGPIYDNQGKLRVPEGKALTEAELRKVDWYAQGILP
jgi:basic membrane protein A